jgi:hypothetical protein
VRLIDGQNFQVNLGAESAVQLEFSPTEMTSLLQGAEIEKTKIDRFFYFENKRRNNEDPGNVSLHGKYLPWLVWIGIRRLQEIDQLSRRLRSRIPRFFARCRAVIWASPDHHKPAFMSCFQRRLL